MARIKITDFGWYEGVPKPTAQVILKKWVDLKERKAKLYEHPIKLPQWAGTYADLKQVDLADIRGAENKAAAYSEQKKQENNRYYQEQDKEYFEYKRVQLRKPLEERAKNMNIARFVWMGATGEQEIPHEVQEKIAERQLKFLKEHPGYMYANPTCYQDLIPSTNRKLEVTKATTALRKSCFAIAQSLVSRDKFTFVKQ